MLWSVGSASTGVSHKRGLAFAVVVLVVAPLLVVLPTVRCLLPRWWRRGRCFVVLLWSGEREAVGA